MPKIEPKPLHQDIRAGRFAPFYWFYGSEHFLSRELLEALRLKVFGDQANSSQNRSFNEVVLDASEVSSYEVVDAAQSMSLGGGTKLVVVKQAHLLKEPEVLIPLMGEVTSIEKLNWIVVCLSKDLDQRKKFSKVALKKAVVVACEPISDLRKEAWIRYLANRKGLTLSPETLFYLCAQDPWSLDQMERELEKLELFQEDLEEPTENSFSQNQFNQKPVSSMGSSSAFVDSFFYRQKKQALLEVREFAEDLDVSLPLLGLMNWNTKFLAFAFQPMAFRVLALRESQKNQILKLSRYWTLDEVVELQSQLAQIDFALKQTQRLPLGVWSELVIQFCR